MSVMIRGMEMPTSCYDCNCFIRDSDGGDYCCLLMIDIENNNKRDNDCPLVPVPPHGRLIAEDDAIETAWMILSGLGYHKEENTQLEQTVREVFATAPSIELR